MRKMKDSGIEWIGEIPEGWEVGQIGQLYSERRTKVSDKNSPPLSVTMKGILPQLSTAAKTDAHDDRKLVCKGDFAINSRSDRRGSCGISEQDGSISLINTVLQPRGEMNPGYYNWLFHTSMFADEFYKWGHGIVDDLWTTGWSDMKKIGVPVPSKCEQKQLAEHLNFECSNIDTILSKTRSSIEEYKKLKQAVITQAVTKGVRGEREMKDSRVEWIGEIPKEWSVSPMKHFIDILPGYAFSSDDFCIEEGIPLLRGINVGVNEIRWDETVRWNHSISKQLESFFLKENDLVVGLDRPWISDGTRVAFIAKKDLPCLLLQRVCRIRTRCNFDIRWIYYWLSGSSFKDSLSTETTGISVPHISTKQIEQFIVAFPNLLEQTQVCNYLDAKCAEIDKLIAKKEQLVNELESYKRSLIYEVVTGKREV